jgi:DNA-binding NarL/FixJ family response regulator
VIALGGPAMHIGRTMDIVTEQTVEVGIVEDDEAIRESLAAIINSTAGFSCTQVFDSYESAEKGLCLAPSVLLMDINLPGIGGIEGVRRLKAHFPSMQILMFTVYEENEKIFESLCAGASGYLLKKSPPQKIIEAIGEVMAGGAPMSATIARKVLDLFKAIAPPAIPDSNLTRREREILEHLVHGSTYKTISNDLFISIDTVSSHVRHIYEKLHVHSKSEAVAKALKHRLV